MTEMSEDESSDEKLEVLIKETSKRRHASYFHFADRPAAEAGVVNVFAESLMKDNQLFFKEARHSGEDNDPPDCEALSLSGERIGIEVTELVNGNSIAAVKKGASSPFDYEDWNQALIPKLAEILQKKDKAKIKGGPYSEYVLLIASDETWLLPDFVEQSLAKHIFSKTRLITKAYLLLGYDPSVQRCPYFRLKIEGVDIG